MGKRFGQHFLRAPAVVEKIMAAAAVTPGEATLEVGPGLGVLTGEMLAAGARLTAVEIDPALCELLRKRWGEEQGLRLVEGNVLTTDLSPQALFGRPEPYAVVANLPYYVSTPFLFRILAHRRHIARMVLMVQREIAERLVALPAEGKVYGSLSVAAHHAFAMKRLFRVPPGAFQPPPKVDSAVVAFTPRPASLGPEQELHFLEHVKTLFTTRRKLMLSVLLRNHPDLAPSARERLTGLIGEKRAEVLTPEEHLAVFRVLLES